MSVDNLAPVVSVVIPCFNAETWLAQAIDSVLAQLVPDVEIIVVNDGSTDRSRSIAEQYGAQITIINQVNCGVSASRREGVSRAKGKFIKFLDADDLLPANSLKQLLQVARSFPREAVLGRSVAVDESGKIVEEGMYALPIRPQHGSAVPHEFLLTQPTSSGLWLLPKDVVDRDECFDPMTKFAEEFVLCAWLVSKKIPVRACDAVVYHARQHRSPARLSMTRQESDHLRQVDLMRMAANLIRTELPEHDPLAMTQLARLSWSRGRDCLRIGRSTAAARYFELAQELRPGLSPVGSFLYRCTCHFSGPVVAEQVFSSIKRFLKRSQPA